MDGPARRRAHDASKPSKALAEQLTSVCMSQVHKTPNRLAKVPKRDRHSSSGIVRPIAFSFFEHPQTSPISPKNKLNLSLD
jgi:hypothetical protein